MRPLGNATYYQNLNSLPNIITDQDNNSADNDVNTDRKNRQFMIQRLIQLNVSKTNKQTKNNNKKTNRNNQRGRESESDREKRVPVNVKVNVFVLEYVTSNTRCIVSTPICQR